MVFAFRGTIPDESEHKYLLAGLEPARRYSLHFQDGSAPDRTATGEELMGQGLQVHLQNPLSSELVLLNSTVNAK